MRITIFVIASMGRSACSILQSKHFRKCDCTNRIHPGLLLRRAGLLWTGRRKNCIVRHGVHQRRNHQPGIFPYFYPEVLFQQAWGYIGRKEDFPPERIVSVVSPLSDTTRVETLSAEIAHRYEKQAKGVAFGDPDAILSMMATLCRDKYVALYGSANSKKVKDIEVSAYTEQYTCVMEDIKQLTEITDNYVLVGRRLGTGTYLNGESTASALKSWIRTGRRFRASLPFRIGGPIQSAAGMRTSPATNS